LRWGQYYKRPYPKGYGLFGFSRVITIADVVILLDANQDTVKLHLRKLAQQGIWCKIKPVRGRGIRYGETKAADWPPCV
jgi:Fic family protein